MWVSLVAALIVVYAAPIAAGSEFPRPSRSSNKVPRSYVRTLIAKATGVLFSVAGGLPLGKEGPMNHSGAVVAAGVSQGKSTTFGFDTAWSKFLDFRMTKKKGLCVVRGRGVAAGLVPPGGVLFCLRRDLAGGIRILCGAVSSPP